MRSNGLRYSAALAAVLAMAPVNALAQSTDGSAADVTPGSIVLAQQTYIDVMANLEASGYTIVQTKSTFLGRVQITARNAAHLREIVVSRATGEVKRDVILEVFATADGGASVNEAAPAAASDASTGSGGLLGALGFKANTNVSAGVSGFTSGGYAPGGSGGGGSASSGSLSGSLSGGLSGGLGIGKE